MKHERSNMPSNILTRTMALNAGFSAVTGVILVIGAVPLSRWLGIPTWLSIAVGVGLLPFAVAVAKTARSPRRSTVRQVIIADIAWVICAAVVLIGFPGSMSTAGLWALGLVTVTVADFAALQVIGLRRPGMTG
jgi:hypothetical protein